MGVDYSKIMKRESDKYEWQVKFYEECRKDLERKEQDGRDAAAKIREDEKLRTEEFITPFLKHPLTQEMIEQLKSILPRNRKKADPVYILDLQGRIIALVTSKNALEYWVRENGYSKKKLGRTTVFEYIRNRSVYKNLYFVPAKEYENFIEEFVL
ncbi:hypothetical protein [Bacillus sp. SJS]|uniref:hypothetical protein n=1 Tax=Bacillus sp. SJS TaxID=1423321 RepID=UPI0004DCF274|nr:hypothetical protein [Bacillus sp. SJS]KZZ86233.1 hypothetical protein AS29_001265 [Bacillus sp. SJS]